MNSIKTQADRDLQRQEEEWIDHDQCVFTFEDASAMIRSQERGWNLTAPQPGVIILETCRGNVLQEIFVTLGQVQLTTRVVNRDGSVDRPAAEEHLDGAAAFRGVGHALEVAEKLMGAQSQAS